MIGKRLFSPPFSTRENILAAYQHAIDERYTAYPVSTNPSATLMSCLLR